MLIVATLAAVALGASAHASTSTTTTTASASSASAPGAHPTHNIVANPAYVGACAQYQSNSTACITRALAAINNARALEHVRPMVLPRNFAKLSYREQTFVVSNLERVDRGLRPLRGLTRKLNRTATAAADANVDPSLVFSAIGQFVITTYGSNWTANFGPLAGDYGWMYDDGYGSYNVDCTTPTSAGCWAHRDVILAVYDSRRTLLSGVGTTKQNGLLSDAQLFVVGHGPTPAFTYTWREALRHGADGGLHS